MSARNMYDKSYVKPKYRPTNKKQNGKVIPGGLLLICLGFTGLAMLSATVGALLAVSLSSTPLQKQEFTPEEKKQVYNPKQTIEPKPLQIPELNRPVNILVLGTKVLTSDLKEEPEIDLGYHALVNSFEGHTDTMLLLRFDPDKNKIVVLSIPRDTKAYIEGYGTTKINAANYKGGPALSAKTISNLLAGVTIDRYVRVNVQGVEKLIDALGGVTVYVPKDMKYTDYSQHLYINLEEGKQHLDGNKAIQFLRFRHDRYGDIGRVQRQQILMRAAIEQALKPSILMRVPTIFSTIDSNIDTNLSVEELLALANFATTTKRSEVQMLMLPGDFSGNGKNGAISYWIPQKSLIPKIMAEHFDIGESDLQPKYTKPARVKVAIQDSTGDPQAVRAMIKYLREVGYRRIYLGARWRENLDVTRILAQKGDDGAAAVIRTNLGIGEVLVESTGVLASDVTIILGEDWREIYESLDSASPSNSRTNE